MCCVFVACVHALTCDSDVTVFFAARDLRTVDTVRSGREALSPPTLRVSLAPQLPTTTCGGMWGSEDSLPPPSALEKNTESALWLLAQVLSQHSGDRLALMAV